MHSGANRGWIYQGCRYNLQKRLLSVSRRCFTTTLSTRGISTGSDSGDEAKALARRTRNIGIIAHIDAVCNVLLLLSSHAQFCAGQNYNHGAYALLQWAYSPDWRYIKSINFQIQTCVLVVACIGPLLPYLILEILSFVLSIDRMLINDNRCR